MISASNKRRERSLRDYEEFSRWHRGDLTGVIDPQASSEGYRWQYGLENMTNLAHGRGQVQQEGDNRRACCSRN